MARELRFPDVGEGIAEGEIVRWLVVPGDKVQADQPLVEIETDKAVVEIPAPCRGTILRLPVKAGEKIQVGDVVAVLEEENPGEAAATAPVEAASVSVVGRLDTQLTELPPPPELATRPGTSSRRILAIPSVRKLARQLGIDLRHVTPTGPRERIRREDVLQAARATSQNVLPPRPPADTTPALPADKDAYGPVTRQELSALRRTIARTMMEAATTAVPVTTTDEVDVTELVVWRERSRTITPDTRMTLLPFIMKAIVAALRQHPSLNASYDDANRQLVCKHYYHLGIATDTPDGLLVPVLKDVDRKNLLALATELQHLTEQARQRRIALADMQGGTFTISNYGAIGGIFATPMLLLPQVAILGVGKLLQKPAVHHNAIAIRTLLPLSLTFDHRALDGAAAQHFLNNVMDYLAEPTRLMLTL